MKSILFAVVFVISSAQASLAKEPLSNVAYINDRLFAAAVGIRSDAIVTAFLRGCCGCLQMRTG